MKKAFINGKIVLEDQILRDKIIVFEDHIEDIYDSYDLDNLEVIDLEGLYVSPGFIDIHRHGAKGCDVMDASIESIKTICKSLVETGVTGFLPTTMTQSKKAIYEAIKNIKLYKEEQSYNEARIYGVHLEGPFISPVYKGAQNPDFISNPDKSYIQDFYETLSIITFAPELPGAMGFFNDIKEGHKHIKFSIGHSAANYDQALYAYEAGVESTTHLFNAMTGLHHREPGIVGAVLKKRPYFELIADMIHCHRDLYDILGHAIGIDKMILVTDAMCACHMPPGNYQLGGQEVIVDENSARLKNGTLAGSILKMNEAIKNVVDHTSYSLSEVVNMCTKNPADLLNLEKTGTIKKGNKSDFSIFDDDIKVKMTWIQGQLVYREEI